MPLDVVGGLVESESHPTMTSSAWRKDCAGDRCHLMRMSVIVSIQPIMDYIIDARVRHLVSGCEFTFSCFHIALDFFKFRCTSFFQSQRTITANPSGISFTFAAPP